MSSSYNDAVMQEGSALFDIALIVLLLNVGVLAHILLKHDKSTGERLGTRKKRRARL